MKKETDLENFHVGRWIQGIASEKQIKSRLLADAILRYPGNADKIFKLKDFYAKDLRKMSEPLDCNLLLLISEKFLSQIPFFGKNLSPENYHVNLNTSTNIFNINDKDESRKDSIKDFKIGKHIKHVLKEKGWTMKQLANRLGCTKVTIDNLLESYDLKTKKLILLSEVLDYNLITEGYLSAMDIKFSFPLFDGSTIKLSAKHAESGKANEGTFEFLF